MELCGQHALEAQVIPVTGTDVGVRRGRPAGEAGRLRPWTPGEHLLAPEAVHVSGGRWLRRPVERVSQAVTRLSVPGAQTGSVGHGAEAASCVTREGRAWAPLARADVGKAAEREGCLTQEPERSRRAAVIMR